jgi:hypothetical protein
LDLAQWLPLEDIKLKNSKLLDFSSMVLFIVFAIDTIFFKTSITPISTLLLFVRFHHVIPYFPKTIHYALNETEREIIRVVQPLTWLELDDLTDSIVACMPNANRSNVYRTLVCFGINRMPQEKKHLFKSCFISSMF